MNLVALIFAALFLCTDAEKNYHDSVGPLEHFQLTALYFADSVLKGLKIGDMAVEDAPFLDIYENIGKLLADQAGNRLKKLSKSFSEGFEYGKVIHELGAKRTAGASSDLEASILKAEKDLFDRVKSGKEVLIPAGWAGHAILMSMSPSTKGSGFFDLRVFNLGEGLQFHEVIPDSSGTYPYLVKPWVSYSGIPWNLVEAEPRFFTLGLVHALDEQAMKKVQKRSQYFYGELLGNFDDYRVEPAENGKQLFATPQRSGTCTVSTCMARVMLEHDSIVDYSRTRIKIGIFLLQLLAGKYEKDDQILKMAKSGVEFKKVLSFALSSLAREAFNMLSLENSKDYTCYPTTQKFKALIFSQDSTTFNSKISVNDLKLLKQVTEVSLKILAWLESIQLDFSNFSFEGTSINCPNVANFLKDDFKEIPTENDSLPKVQDEKYDLKRFPILNANNVLTSSADIYKILSSFVEPGSFSFLNLVKLTKMIDFENDPEAFDDIDANSWRKLYFQILKSMPSEAHNMDCLLAFHKLSFYIWKVAVLQDSKKGPKSLNLANFAPTLGTCIGREMALFDDMGEMNSQSYQRIPAYDPNLFTESKAFCDLIKRKYAGKGILIKVDFYSSNGKESSFQIDSKIMNQLKDSEEFKEFKIQKNIPETESDRFNEMVQCARSSKLVQTYPQFYLLELIAFGTTALNERSTYTLNPANESFACYYDTHQNPWFVSFSMLNFDDTAPKFIENICKDIYSPNHSLSFWTFIDEIEHSNAANVFKRPEFNMIVDKLLFSSEMLRKAINERPELAKRLLSALGALFEQQVKKFESTFKLNDFRTQIIRSDLEGFADFSFIFARTMFRLLQVTGDSMKDSIKQYWTDLHAFWYKLSGASGIKDTKIRQIINDAQFGKVNFLLAYLLSLSRKYPNLRVAVSNAYCTRSDSLANISAAMAAHYFAGAHCFELAQSNWIFLLDKLYKSRSLLAEVLEEIDKKTLNKTLLTPLLEIFLKRINGENVKFAEAKEVNSDPDLLNFICQGNNGNEPKQYRIRISTAEITINGRKLVTKKQFLNMRDFYEFFSKNLPYASNGTLNYDLKTVAYEIKNYLVSGADYRLFLKSSDLLNIYRKISRASKSEYYRFWHFEGSNFGLLNTQGLDSYLYRDKTNATEFAWIPREKSEAKYFARYAGIRILEVPSINSGPLIFLFEMNKYMHSDEIKISPILKKFASGIPISVYKEHNPNFEVNNQPENSTIVVLLQPFLVDGNPLAFKFLGSEVIWMNDPSYILHREQVINKQEPFSPVLILQKKSQPKTFIALVPELVYNFISDDPENYAKTNLIKVHKIELKSDLSGFNAHTRVEKLILAYHNLHYWNFKEALKLLKRDSIHHNALFNDEETRLLRRIVTLSSMEHPEGIALKLMAFCHLKLDSMEKLGENGADLAKLDLLQLLRDYLMSMRDLSRHYYVHLKFPELTEKESGLFSFSSEIFSANFGLREAEAPKIMEIAYEYKYNPTKITDSFIFEDNLQLLALNQFIKTLYISRPNDLPKGFETNDIFKSVLASRDNKGIDHKFWDTLFKLRRPRMSQDLLRSYCLVKGINNKELENQIIENLNQFCKSHPGSKLLFQTPACEVIVSKKELERSFNAPEGNPTDQEVILSRMKDDLIQKVSQKQADEKEAFDLSALRVTNETDIELFAELSKEIESNWFIQKQHKSHKPPTSSNTLIQLDTAIDDFDAERLFFNFKACKASKILETLNFLQKLNDRITALSKSLDGYKDELKSKSLKSFNQTGISWMLSFLDKIFNQRKENTFENLYSCYFTSSLECFGNKFPHLSKEDLKALRIMTFNYFSETNLRSYMETVQNLVTEFEALKQKTTSHSFTIESIVKDLLVEIKKMADFDYRIRQPGLLNFEFKSGSVRLRKEQLDDVLALKARKDENSLPFSTVIQRMMAAGKTFVLGTLASVLKADGKTLSILVPPSSLYQSNTLSMQERTLKYFKSRGKTFHFPRFSTPNYLYNQLFLKLVLDRIKKTIENKDYLIMDPSDLSAFHNSFIEYFENLRLQRMNKEHASTLKLHAEIYQIFKKQTSIILDEIDMTMAPKLELNYPTPDREKMNMDAATLSADLLLYTAFNEDIKSAGLQILKNNQHNFDQARMDKVRNLWKKYVEEKLNDEKGIWYRLIIHPNKKTSNLADKDFSKSVIEFIFESILPDKFNAKLEATSKQTHSTLAILRMQVQKWISSSLNGAVFEKYGPSMANWTTIKYAIPYLSANTPNESSVFADRWETLNKTLLMYIIKPFTFAEISALALSILNMKSEGDPFALEIEGLFNKVTKIELHDILFDSNDLIAKDSKVDFEAAFVSKSTDVLRLIFVYVLKHVMEPIEYFKEQITSNALNMTSMFGSVQGYSGTIDNVNTLPKQLVSTAISERETNEKNNGGIVAKLLDDAYKNPKPVTVIDSDAQTAVDILKAALKDVDPLYFNAFIDVGAFFKAFTNAQVAEAVFQTFTKIQAVIYYDERSNRTRFMKRGISAQFELPSTDVEVLNELTKTELAERFTFYDQRHITGSDIRQHPTAKALLSVGPKVLLRDILQGTLRLRQFMAGQMVHFVTTTSVEDLLISRGICADGKVKIEDLIALAGANEDDKQNKENVKLAFTKIDNEIRNFALEILAKDVLDEVKAEIIVKKFSAVRPLFIRSTREEPSKWLTEIKYADTEQVLKTYIENKLSSIKSQIPNLEELQKILNELIPDLKRFLTDKMPQSVSPTEDVELHLEVKQEQDTELGQEVDQAFELFLQQEMDNIFKGLKLGYPSVFASLASINEHAMRAIQSSFVTSENVLTSMNAEEMTLAKIGLGPNNLSFAANLVNFGSYGSATTVLHPVWSREGHGFIYFKDEKEGVDSLILINSPDMSILFRKDIAKKEYTPEVTRPGKKYCFTDMLGNYIGPNSDLPFLLKSNLFDIDGVKKKYLESFFKAHLFNGAMNYISTLPELREQFGRWLRLLDLTEKERTESNIRLRLKFLALKLKSKQKDEFIFDKATDPFIKLLYKTLNSDDLKPYHLLLALFPTEMTKENRILQEMNFSAKTNDNIWKHFKPGLLRMDVGSSIDEHNINGTAETEKSDENKVNQEEKETESKRSSFIYIVSIILVLAVIAGVAFFFFWKRSKKSEEESFENLPTPESLIDEELQDTE